MSDKNKNTNYIAAVEKAIVKKYGKNTVQDFRSEWSPEKEKQYLQQLKVRNDKTKKKKEKTKEIIKDDVVIKIRSSNANRDRTCPVCKTYSFSSADDLYMNRFGCCHNCFVDFVQHEEERWNSGWRPTPEHLSYAFRRRKNGNRFGNY